MSDSNRIACKNAGWEFKTIVEVGEFVRLECLTLKKDNLLLIEMFSFEPM